jgi:hypothetical protein
MIPLEMDLASRDLKHGHALDLVTSFPSWIVGLDFGVVGGSGARGDHRLCL